MAITTPKVLLWDLENTPSKGWYFDKYRENNIVAMDEDWWILSVGWKWLGESRSHVLGLDDFPNYKRNKKDDKQLVLKIRELLDQADITIAHNGDAFDLKKAHARMLIHNIDPPSPSRQIDTLKIARKVAKFSSNKLGDLGESLGLGGKAETEGIDTWLGCMEGNEKAWRIMKKYNKADVDLLEQVYLRLMPWAPTLPNLTVLTRVPDSCPRPGCGAEGQMVRRGTWTATTRVYDKYRCGACGGYSNATRSVNLNGNSAIYKAVG